MKAYHVTMMRPGGLEFAQIIATSKAEAIRAAIQLIGIGNPMSPVKYQDGVASAWELIDGKPDAQFVAWEWSHEDQLDYPDQPEFRP